MFCVKYFVSSVLLSACFGIPTEYDGSRVSPVIYPDDEETCGRVNGKPGQCVKVTLCTSAVDSIAAGKSPRRCGWRDDVPMVCCERDVNTDGAWRGGCGLRFFPRVANISEERIEPTEDGDVLFVVDENPTPLPSGIDPRNLGFQDRLRKAEQPSSTLLDGTGGTQDPWPWMAAILEGGVAKTFLCGGVLIDERHVLTAAHCFDDKSVVPKDYTTKIGVLTIQGGLVYGAEEIKLHPDYIPGSYHYDIAIVRLVETVTPYREAFPVCLPPATLDIASGRSATVLEWRPAATGTQGNRRVHEVGELPLTPVSQCQDAYSTSSDFPLAPWEEFLCVGPPEDETKMCQEGSGGPLMLQENDQWLLVGIASFGYRCDGSRDFGVFTKVTHYLDWIQDYIRQENELYST